MHVVLSLDCGGLERLVLALIREGQALGQEVAVICLERPGTLADEARAAGAQVRCVHKRTGLDWRTKGRIKAALRELHADVVHTHQVGALFYAGAAARSCRIPVVHTEHGKHYAAHWRTRWLGRVAGRHARRFFCVSADIAAEVRACRVARAAKVIVLPNGIDTARAQQPTDRSALRRKLGIPDGAQVIGTVGRLTEIKCQDVLIRAFARLRTQLPQAHLMLVGDGPSRSTLEALAVELGLAHEVHFTGYQPAPEPFLQIMNVFALTSRSEGMPVTVLEAWAAGVPVVASRVGGLPELIQEARTGLLFAQGNEEELVEVLHRVASDPALADKLRAEGRRCVSEGYTLERMAKAYHSSYAAVLSEESGTRGDAGRRG